MNERFGGPETAVNRWFSQFLHVSVDPSEDVTGDLVPVRLVEELVAPARVEEDGDLPYACTAVEGGGPLNAPPHGADRIPVPGSQEHRPVSYTHLTLPTNREV